MNLHVAIPDHEYDIILEHGILQHLTDVFQTDGKVLIVSDSGVPKQYVDTVLAQYPNAISYIIKQGEASKSFPVYQEILSFLLKNGFQRKDTIIALGGGVVGDLSGFVAASYMRGIRFLNIPTTTLSQIDSSIGGKVAINLDDVKNIVGAFYQPSLVVIDPDVLKTLPRRQVVNGLVEALKAGLIKDKQLYELFLDDPLKHLDDIIYRSLVVKKEIVEQDEKEIGIRKLLNFGHTIGHGYETCEDMGKLLHGEAVALGMLAFLEDASLKQEVIQILRYLQIPLSLHFAKDDVFEKIKHDKKANGDTIDVVIVKAPGNSEIRKMSFIDIYQRL